MPGKFAPGSMAARPWIHAEKGRSRLALAVIPTSANIDSNSSGFDVGVLWMPSVSRSQAQTVIPYFQ